MGEYTRFAVLFRGLLQYVRNSSYFKSVKRDLARSDFPLALPVQLQTSGPGLIPQLEEHSCLSHPNSPQKTAAVGGGSALMGVGAPIGSVALNGSAICGP